MSNPKLSKLETGPKRSTSKRLGPDASNINWNAVDNFVYFTVEDPPRGSFTIRDIMGHYGVSITTAKLYARRMTESGRIESGLFLLMGHKRSGGRERRYWLTEATDDAKTS